MLCEPEKDICVCWLVLGDTDKCEIPVAGLRSMELFPHQSGEFWTGGEAGKCNVVSRDDVADSGGNDALRRGCQEAPWGNQGSLTLDTSPPLTDRPAPSMATLCQPFAGQLLAILAVTSIVPPSSAAVRLTLSGNNVSTEMVGDNVCARQEK